MDADFGGTEMRKALDATFSSRKTDKPTSVFVLTDGDVSRRSFCSSPIFELSSLLSTQAWDLEGVNTTVSTALTSSTSSAPLRVFVLGIGNSASTAMCEGIARAGNGTTQFVVEGESFTGKMARLLKAARSPQLLNVRLELPESVEVEAPKYAKDVDEEFELVDEKVDVEHEKEGKKVVSSLATLSLFDDSEDPLATAADSSKPIPTPSPINLSPPPPIQQAPRTIQSLYPGSRLHAYLILTPASLLPGSIFLRAELVSGQKLKLEVPVITSRLPLDESLPTSIHALAARKLVQDLEDGRHGIKVQGDDEELLVRTVKAHVLRLGKTYSLASSHTSFVAVDESEVDERRKQVFQPCRFVERSQRSPPTGFGIGGQTRCRRAMSPVSLKKASGGGLFGSMGAGIFSSSSSATPPPPPAPRGAPMASACFGAPAASYSASVPSSSGSSFSSSPGGGLFGSAAKPFAASPALNPCLAPAPASASYNTIDMPIPTRAMSATGGRGSLFAQASYGAPPPSATAESTSPPNFTPSDRIDAFARHQAFDGSFSSSALALCTTTTTSTTTLEAILLHLARIRIAPLARVETLSKEEKEKLVATASVIAFWEKQMEKQREEWEGITEKAKEFGEEKVGEMEWEELVRRVRGLV